LLERLIRDPDCLPEPVRTPLGRGANPNHGSYLLYREQPGGPGLTVTAVVWGPGDHAAPHDHHTWGLIGVVQNGIQETRFRRLDDRTRDDHATLERDRVARLRAGEVSLLIPDEDEIHQMDNPTGGVTVEIHVYGRDLAGLERCRFDPETGQVTRWMTRRWDNE
jgi:predicted metal-dependent enzyme (double-stranded beta helix superfamily)